MNVGQLTRSVAPVGSLGPGSKEFRKWAAGLKTGPRAGAPQGCPLPRKNPMMGATLPLDPQIHSPSAWWPCNSGLNTVVDVGSAKVHPFPRGTLAYTVVSYSSSSWEVPTLRYCRRGVVGEEYSSARMVFRSRRSIK